MKGTYLNFKNYIDECIRNRARSRKLYALLAVLSVIVSVSIINGLMRPAITVSAIPECGYEEHVHSGKCYEQHLTCGMQEGEEHSHGEGCYATVLVCERGQHSHTEACYPKTIVEETMPPQPAGDEEKDENEAAAMALTADTEEDIAVDTNTEEDAIEDTIENTIEDGAEEAGEETIAPTAEAMIAPDADWTAEPSVEPTAAETAAPTDDAEAMELGELTGTGRMLVGETGQWSVSAENVQAVRYEICAADGRIMAQGDLQPDALRFSYAAQEAGLYTVRVTAGDETDSRSSEMQLAVSAGEMSVQASAGSRSCFGGEQVSFALNVQGGVAPVKCSVQICQGEQLLFEAEDCTQETVSAVTRALEQVTEVCLHAVAVDACGDTATADVKLPCAVRGGETRSEWERSFAKVELTGAWGEDILAIARTQLGYRESKTDFVIDEEGKQKGYTRYGDWYGARYEDWCAMYVSFCLRYAEIPERYFPREASCEKWMRELKQRGLWADAKDMPMPGDLIFFDWDGDGHADHVGMIEDVQDGKLTTIEGNSGNQVRRNEYKRNEGTILGYGCLNGAYEAWLEENAMPEATAENTIEPSAEPTEILMVTATPAAVTAEPTAEVTSTPTVAPTLIVLKTPEVTVEPTSTPEATAEASVEPTVENTIEPSVEPSVEASVEPSMEPEEEAEAGSEIVQGLSELVEALVKPAADADEETMNAYAAQYDAAAEAVIDACEDGRIDEPEASRLLVMLVERQMGGASERYTALHELVYALRKPAEEATADAIIEYDNLRAALREQVETAYANGEMSRVEYTILQRKLERVPVQEIKCVYTALDGALQLVHAENENFNKASLNVEVYGADAALYGQYMEEMRMILGLDGLKIDDALMMDIDFAADPAEADVSLRLSEEMAVAEDLRVAHRGANGWEWLDVNRIVDEEGASWVCFHAEEFSPFAVVCVSESAQAGADIASYMQARGGSIALNLSNADGTALEMDEEGVYTVTSNAEYALKMQFACSEGFAAGAYIYNFPTGCLPVAADGEILAGEAEIGRWSVDAENGQMHIALAEAADAFEVNICMGFEAGEELIQLDENWILRCIFVLVDPVAEVCEGDNWEKLRDSGYFSYWSNKISRSSGQRMASRTSTAVQTAEVKEPNAPSSVQVDEKGGEKSDDDVTVSKTIAGTELENVFDITLTVETPTEVKEFYNEPDMAVVIVMDISNTMRDDFGGKTRYEAAMLAAEDFLDQFAEKTQGVSKVGYVAFNTDAHQIFDLQACSTNGEATALKNTMRQSTSKIMSVYVDEKGDNTWDHSRFTNIEGGLKMAQDMLNGVSNKNKFIILLTDGFPTTYLENGYKGYDPYDTTGRFYDHVLNVPCSSGTSYSDEAAIRARNMAASIRNSGTTIFSIGVDVGGQTIQKYITQSEDLKNSAKISIVDRKNMSYEIGDASSTESYKNWLRNSIGSGYYYDSTNTAGLKDAYKQIFETIKNSIQQSTQGKWVTEDPLPQEAAGAIEFIGLYDKGGVLSGTSLTGSNVVDGENTASYDNDKSTISWDLKASGYKKTTDGGKTIYTYKLTYRVRLKNEESGFMENDVHNTNGTTTMDYRVLKNENGSTTIKDASIEYPIPEVHGYLGELEFEKVDDGGYAVEGAKFTLTHDASCNICRGDGTAVEGVQTLTATSGEDGKVSFSGIPSGHTYKLVESEVPAHYLKNENSYTVVVAYDVVTVTADNGDAWDGKIVNTRRPVLPETGGGGTFIYTIGGFALMAMSLLGGCALQRRRGRRSKHMA